MFGLERPDPRRAHVRYDDPAEQAVARRIQVMDTALALTLGAPALDLGALDRGEELVVGGHGLDVFVTGHRPEARPVGFVVPVQGVVVPEDPEHRAVRAVLERSQIQQVHHVLRHVHIHPL